MDIWGMKVCSRDMAIRAFLGSMPPKAFSVGTSAPPVQQSAEDARVVLEGRDQRWLMANNHLVIGLYLFGTPF